MMHFSKGKTCEDWQRKMWPKVESAMLPLIKMKANRVWQCHHGIDYDDVVQEGKVALLSAMTGYDYNKGDLRPYLSSVLDNTYKIMIHEMLCPSRMPQRKLPVKPGEVQTTKHASIQSLWPVSLDGILANSEQGAERLKGSIDLAIKTPSPEDMAVFKDKEKQARAFRLAMLKCLKRRERHVFFCRINPPSALLKMAERAGNNRQGPTNLHIAEYLGLSKNSVDWSLHKIRETFIKTARQKKFSDLFGHLVDTKEWPRIHASNWPSYDARFVANTLRDRKLSHSPLKDYREYDDYYQQTTDGACSRMIKRFEWGVVLVLKRGKKCCTLVAEGRFNEVQGVVHGSNGTHETLPVKWYKQLVKEINNDG
jgi:RNA polymerase sigma factor (sigma-70 family)